MNSALTSDLNTTASMAANNRAKKMTKSRTKYWNNNHNKTYNYQLISLSSISSEKLKYFPEVTIVSADCKKKTQKKHYQLIKGTTKKIICRVSLSHGCSVFYHMHMDLVSCWKLILGRDYQYSWMLLIKKLVIWNVLLFPSTFSSYCMLVTAKIHLILTSPRKSQFLTLFQWQYSDHKLPLLNNQF